MYKKRWQSEHCVPHLEGNGSASMMISEGILIMVSWAVMGLGSFFLYTSGYLSCVSGYLNNYLIMNTWRAPLFLEFLLLQLCFGGCGLSMSETLWSFVSPVFAVYRTVGVR